MATWTAEQQADLAAIVWRALRLGLESGLGNRGDRANWPQVPVPSSDWLQREAATFVTLEKHGQLRGCIGSLQADLPLGRSVAEHTLAAAFNDPRFEPLQPDELPDLTAEISILTPMEPLPSQDWSDLAAKLQPGVHGLVVRSPGHCATFLPAVWDDLPEIEVFLDQLWRKAGLRPRAWPEGLRLWTYRADKLIAAPPQ
jgi:AmmeMemoRadiSam system protein A